MSGPLWTSFEAAAATGGRIDAPPGADGWAVGGLSIDTRTLVPGDLFVALADVRDGHDFLGAAAAAGAAAALVTHRPDDAPQDLPLLVVEDPLAAVQALARAARDRNFGRLIGVTGSAGKTSTKEMLRAALAPSGQVHAAAKSFNNHIGVPITLASLPASADFGVFEIGMNHAGEITPLTGLVQPHVAIITTVAAAHLEHFKSVDDIAAAKAEILNGLRPGGVAILPADNAYFGQLADAAADVGVGTILPFGQTADPILGVRLDEYSPGPGGASVRATVLGQAVGFTLKAPGKHQAMNAMAVLAAAHAVGAPLEQTLAGLSAFVPGDGRGATHSVAVHGHQVQVLDESYNANPASMGAAFDVLHSTMPYGTGRRIAVLGEMKELGADSVALHQGLAGPLLGAKTDLVLTAGQHMEPLSAVLPDGVAVAHAQTAADLLAPLLEVLRDGDVILFKGSNASGLGSLLKAFLAKADRAG